MKHLKLFRNIDFNSKENLSKEEEKEKDKSTEKEIEFDFEKLEENISKLEYWIFDYSKDNSKLGMKKMIIEIFKKYNYYNNIDIEIEKLKNDIEILKKTDYSKIKINEIERNLEKYLEKTYLVKTMQDGKMKWDPVNKLNTNYVELSRLIVYLIKCTINDDNERIRKKGIDFYVKLSSAKSPYELKKELLLMRDTIEKMIIHYMINNSKTKPIDGRVGLGDFKKFTSYSEYVSKIGEKTEKDVINYLKLNGFEILYEGGNGDLIDMLFWVDIIVKHDNFGYKTIQVKTKSDKKVENRYRNVVNWLIRPRKNYEFNKPEFIILDLKTNEEIQIN